MVAFSMPPSGCATTWAYAQRCCQLRCDNGNLFKPVQQSWSKGAFEVHTWTMRHFCFSSLGIQKRTTAGTLGKAMLGSAFRKTGWKCAEGQGWVLLTVRYGCSGSIGKTDLRALQITPEPLVACSKLKSERSIQPTYNYSENKLRVEQDDSKVWGYFCNAVISFYI